MQYIDITNSPERFEQKLAKRLGFSRFVNANDQIIIADRAGPGAKPLLIQTTNPNLIFAMIKSPKAIGILSNGEEVEQRVLNKLKENGKLVVFNAYYLTVGQRDRVSKIHRLKKLFRMAGKSKTRMGIVSLAPNQDYLLSSAQLLEIAKLITADDHQAKLMLSNIGETLHDI
ncbi:MAG: hypothetical protein KGH61_00725 [Candidatus Micrarchaeota archaeon]|nr:hypothetical protein [Candidatus Micrarchaeota archaeon]MDE1847460.1 hypothetical protein [Candidatus Micrarchaeota archaeon]MDE1864045.1 hypothetical protein [Candidatus Micrarchaeota archaeon]